MTDDELHKRNEKVARLLQQRVNRFKDDVRQEQQKVVAFIVVCAAAGALLAGIWN